MENNAFGYCNLIFRVQETSRNVGVGTAIGRMEFEKEKKNSASVGVYLIFYRKTVGFVEHFYCGRKLVNPKKRKKNFKLYFDEQEDDHGPNHLLAAFTPPSFSKLEPNAFTTL